MAKIATHRVLLLRTGATAWDIAGRVQGQTDLPLSVQGRVELTQAIQQLGHPPLSTVLCPEDEASRETAEMLAAAAGVRVAIVPELNEMAFGLWEGVLRAELESRFCRAGRLWGENPCCITPPEGESFDGFAERLLGGLKRTIAKARSRGGRRSTSNPPAVGIVLRPVGEALARCTLAGLPATDLAVILKDRPGPTWIDVDVEAEWSMPVRPALPRRETTASAA